MIEQPQHLQSQLPCQSILIHISLATAHASNAPETLPETHDLTSNQVMLERGERPKAKYNYEKILGKALLGHGRAEHWAHSEYAWIAFEDGDLEVTPTRPPCSVATFCSLLGSSAGRCSHPQRVA